MTTFTFQYLKLEIAIFGLYLARLLHHLPTTTIGICSTWQFLTFSFPLFILAISCTLSFVQFLFNFCEFNRMANVQCAVIFVLWLTVYVTLLQTSIMFTHAEQLWPILQDIRKAGYMPYLLLVPDPNGPLREHHQHPTVQTEFEPAHMDHMKEMVHRWRYKSGICIWWIVSCPGFVWVGTLVRGRPFGEGRIAESLRRWGRWIGGWIRG